MAGKGARAREHARTSVESAGFVCPDCRTLLEPLDDGVLVCPLDALIYRHVSGIWDMLPPARADRFHQFVDEYDHIRRDEGRGSEHSEYFRRLPSTTSADPFRFDWSIRAATYQTLINRVVHPMEGKRLRILDVGAGNGWLSNRLSRRGHDVTAVDLRTGARDGLGAHVHYNTAFTCVRAEFDRLPFPHSLFDLVVFNASFHYAADYDVTLREAIRVLRPAGCVVIADSPVYPDAADGERMVAERKARFLDTYGFESSSLDAREFLTPAHLRRLSVRLGVTWTWHRPRYGLRWAVRRVVGQFRNGRASAQFALIVGSAEADPTDMASSAAPHPVLRTAGRALLGLRFILWQRRRLRRPVQEVVAGIRLTVWPGVFNPVLFRSGAFLAETVAEGVLPDGASVLDLGTGTGVSAIAAAKEGGHVVAVDIHPKAVGNARENVRRNGVSVEVLQADLFAGAGMFDVVLFNPPYYEGRPRTAFEHAWMCEDDVDRFSRDLRTHLRDGGFALVVLSTDGRGGDYLRRFASDGYRISRVRERRFANETLAIYRISPST